MADGIREQSGNSGVEKDFSFLEPLNICPLGPVRFITNQKLMLCVCFVKNAIKFTFISYYINQTCSKVF